MQEVINACIQKPVVGFVICILTNNVIKPRLDLNNLCLICRGRVLVAEHFRFSKHILNLIARI